VTLRSDVRHGVEIARVELRRSLRKSVGTRKKQLTLLGVVALFAPVLVFWFRIAYDAGQQAASARSFSVEILGIQVTLLVVVFVAMGALSVVQQGRPDGEALLLTTTSPRAVLLGTVIHSTIRLVGFVLLPTLLFAGSFALGAGMPSIVLTTVVAMLPLFTAVSMLGTVVGQLVVLGLLKSRLVRRVSRGFGLVLVLALMALSYAAMAPVVGQAEPLGVLSDVLWPGVAYLAFAFVGTPLNPGLDTRSLLVGTLVLASIPVLFVVANRLAPRLWFADATPPDLLQRETANATPNTTSSVAVNTPEHAERLFPPTAKPRPLALAFGLWVRWFRIPVRFSALFPVVIIVASALFGAVNDPTSLPLVVGFVLIFVGVYMSGAIFGLNPLGEAGGMRVVEFLSPTAPRTLVLGHMFAGLFVGLPLTVVGATLLAVATGMPMSTTAVVAVLAVVLSVAAAAVSVGVGTVLPSVDSQRTYRGYEVATPSQWALIGYMTAVMVLVGVAALGSASRLLAGGETSFLLGTVAPAVAAGVLLALGYAGYRTAVGRFGAPPYPASSSDSRPIERGAREQ
jgi:ABC-2 type transport system permease protein